MYIAAYDYKPCEEGDLELVTVCFYLFEDANVLVDYIYMYIYILVRYKTNKFSSFIVILLIFPVTCQ
jgi:hypothetical protein